MRIWTVHTSRADEIRPTEAIFTDETDACDHAAAVSKDAGVLAASVVRFVVNEIGNRRNVAMFVGGVRQVVPYISDCRTVHSGGRG